MNQIYSRAQLKNNAREKLTGKYGSAVLLYLCDHLITFSLSFTVTMLFSAVTMVQMFLGSDSAMNLPTYILLYVVTTACSILVGVFGTGIALFYLNISCGRIASLTNLFYGFQYLFKKSLIISATLTLLNTVCLLPYDICYYLFQQSEHSVPLAILTLLLMAIGMIIYIPISLSLSQSFYLLLDFPTYSAGELMKLSCKIMRGHKAQLFGLELSFLPIQLLGVLTFGIGFPWIDAYQNMTKSLYFLQLMRSGEQASS